MECGGCYQLVETMLVGDSSTEVNENEDYVFDKVKVTALKSSVKTI